jgi:hypothetical protein
MATSMTTAQLRGLAKLYRQRVDGAERQLAMIIEHNAHELPELLGFPLKNLERLREHEDPVEVLVATIEGAQRIARELRDRLAYEDASMLAVRLAETAVRRRDGHYALDLDLLGVLLVRYPGRVITFGTRGSCGSLRLRAILRELRDVRATSVVLTNDHIVIGYDGEGCRGMIRLKLHEVVVDDGTLVVPIDMRLDEVDRHVDHVGEHTARTESIECTTTQPTNETDIQEPAEQTEPTDEVDRIPEREHRSRYDTESLHEDDRKRLVETRSVTTTPPVQRRAARVRRPEPIRGVAVRMLETLLTVALGGAP